MANEQLEYKFIPTSRRGRYLCADGYKFRVNRKRNAASWTSWMCLDKNCTSTISTVDDIITKRPGQHNHGPVNNDIKVVPEAVPTPSGSVFQGPTNTLSSEAQRAPPRRRVPFSIEDIMKSDDVQTSEPSITDRTSLTKPEADSEASNLNIFFVVRYQSLRRHAK
ncbi:uncharacterized protein LOC124273173 [Haliotis rubra]|uniref:uncharacterized protein LOC124273173 n=1 Tax=Haliotis rubra TaxID=36100 RepID=UPI001EE57F7D|nr:uncharacterized protein LOC124273173 [Haliotis rubra]